MDPTLYNVVMRGNIRDAYFLHADHLKRDGENGYQVTPKGNMVLHFAVLYGHSHFDTEVLEITLALLCYQNKKNKSALLIAANEGHTEVVRVLLACREDHNTKEKLTRMTDASGDTALHKAVRSQHLDVVKLLVKEDSEFEFLPNHAQETCHNPNRGPGRDGHPEPWSPRHLSNLKSYIIHNKDMPKYM
ncbi:hypothetical protein CQW23_13240 [Capsicum baccatum]|uniref:Uncharacterized protein n=1 Tax=Capsicum baccatum TaxID=33114 RepID=A0A2G2WUZ4_CAPBA|nr:hypothetical protein CQW23_13240 [Capsicum baccatum]